MRSLIQLTRAAGAMMALGLTSCSLSSTAVDQGPLAAVKVINLLQGEDNSAIGFETGRPLSVIVYPSIAPATAGDYYFTAAAKNRQLRVLRTTTTVLDSTVLFAPNTYFTVVTLGVSGTTGVTAPRYLILTNNMGTVGTGNVRLRVIHGASTVPAVDVHVVDDSTAFSATSRIFENLTYGNAATIEGRLANNRKLCVLGTGVLPTANGSNCTVLKLYGVAEGSVMTAAVRDPSKSETKPDVLFSLDRAP